MFQVIRCISCSAHGFQRLRKRHADDVAVWLRFESFFKPEDGKFWLTHLTVQQSQIAEVSPRMLRAVGEQAQRHSVLAIAVLVERRVAHWMMRKVGDELSSVPFDVYLVQRFLMFAIFG